MYVNISYSCIASQPHDGMQVYNVVLSIVECFHDWISCLLGNFIIGFLISFEMCSGFFRDRVVISGHYHRFGSNDNSAWGVVVV